MNYLGDYDLASTIYGFFTTYQPTTGAAFSLAGTPVVRVYKNGSATQHGTTYAVSEFDSLAGLNTFTIDTSADGSFYAAAGDFVCVLQAGTVDSVSVVGTVVARFTLRRSAAMAAIGTPLDLGNGVATLAGNLSDVDEETDEILAAVQGIAVTGAALNQLAGSATLTIGTESSGTYLSTQLDNGVYHVITAAGGSSNARIIDIYYEFTLPNATCIPTQVKVAGYLREGAPAGGDTIGLEAWNGSAWEVLDAAVFTGITTAGPDVTMIHALFSRFVFGANLVRIRFSNTGTLENSTTLNIDQIYVSYAEAISANIALIKTKTDYLPSATAGQANGVFIAGSNAATTIAGLTTGAITAGAITQTGAVSLGATTIASAAITGALSVGTTTTLTGNVTISGTTAHTGHVTYADGIAVTGSTGGRQGLAITGNTSGAGLVVTGGNAAHGATVSAGGGNSHGLLTSGTGSGSGLTATGAGGGTGHGIFATSGSGATGDGIRATSVASAGNGVYLLGTTTGNGLLATGGAGAGGDGIEAVAGGGVPVRGDITGNITGTLATVTTASAVTGLTAADVGAIKTQTDKLAFTVTNQVDANIQSINDTTVLGAGVNGNKWRP